MLPELVTGRMGNIIKPRALKSKEMQKERTKSKAEVFTPTWIVKKQNDEIEKDYINRHLTIINNLFCIILNKIKFDRSRKMEHTTIYTSSHDGQKIFLRPATIEWE
ncbi:hypothetical protein ACWOA6_04255 [Globicatella sulfidifaciens]|nr:hypothetical protein [Globicatella sulfidifaciens]